MTPEDHTTESEEVRQQILAAAEERFRHYGYRKTTMAELARDVGMSAANLYRYFENKEDIAAAFAQRCMGERDEVLREVVRRPGLNAQQRLEEFFLSALRHSHDLACDQPQVSELVETVASQRQEVVHRKLEVAISMLAEILAEGNRTGEFDVQDVVATGETVYSSMVVFVTPIFMRLYPLEELERRARNVVRLLIKGLEKR